MDYNRALWIFIFVFGTASFTYLEWQSNVISAMAWFLLTSLWSATCAIAYTIIDWLLTRTDKTDVNQ